MIVHLNSGKEKANEKTPNLPPNLLVAIILSIISCIIIVATAHKWCQIVRRSRCCAKIQDLNRASSTSDLEVRRETSVVTGVASVTGFVIEATAPTSTGALELPSSIRKAMVIAQINRLPRKIFVDSQQDDSCEKS